MYSNTFILVMFILLLLCTVKTQFFDALATLSWNCHTQLYGINLPVILGSNLSHFQVFLFRNKVVVFC